MSKHRFQIEAEVGKSRNKKAQGGSAFNPSTREGIDRWISLSLGPASSTERVIRQPEIYRETLS